MDKDKQAWLKSIGAGEFPEPVKYIYTFPGYSGAFNLSERYLEETTLEELKAQYQKNKAYAKEVVKLGKLQDEKVAESLSHEKLYEFQAEKGSKVEVKIETKIKDLCKSDLEGILHEYARCTHNFYLSLGKTLAGQNESAQTEKGIECLNHFNDETVFHYCTKQEIAESFNRYGGIDWMIGNECDIKALTADMAGFGTKRSQRVIIDYDRDYGKFLVRRIYEDYGTSSESPVKED